MDPKTIIVLSSMCFKMYFWGSIFSIMMLFCYKSGLHVTQLYFELL